MNAPLRSYASNEYQPPNPYAVSRALAELREAEARLLYSLALNSALDGARDESSVIARMNAPEKVASNPQQKATWDKAAGLLAEIVTSEDDLLLWSIYETIVGSPRSKALGQYFTPRHVASFALSGLNKPPRSILDPMVGNGVFLACALEKFPSCKARGVEIDSLPLMAARVMLRESVALECADVFDWSRRHMELDPTISFSAVVGNPAYVSYQNLNLLADYIDKNPPHSVSYSDFLIKALKDVARHKELGPDVTSLFSHWSGYSDLSMYALVLSWLLAEREGQIAFVMSNHWMERNYGACLRDFLVARGTVRAVVTHRNGNWFPGAQIPASVFLYLKGSVSQRQNDLGIPYVEINAPPVRDLGLYLRSEIGIDFWKWIDSVTEPCRLGPLSVTFRKWHSSGSHLDFGTPAARFNSLQIPDELKSSHFVGLDDLGWSVHQGLRTGCNELFYVTDLDSSKHLWKARVTKNGKKTEIPVAIPDEFLVPVVQKLRANDPLRIGVGQADVRLISLRGAITELDRKSLSDYPKSWLESWGVEKLETLPSDLSKVIDEWATMPYEGKGRAPRPVITLSAIRTNIYRPPSRPSGKIPPPPRFWYQIPVTKRHFGTILVPRVSSGPTRAYLNEDPGSVIIDANFLTFVPEDGSLPAELLWIWLNSNSFRLLCELNGSALGGGALKLEATLLARLPVPEILRGIARTETALLADMLDRNPISNSELIKAGRQIDEILLGHESSIRISKLVEQRISRRSRSFQEGV